MTATLPKFPARRIWRRAAHNAFTDLVKFRNAWWCVFREGETHVSRDGIVRLLRSKDGIAWRTVTCFSDPLGDLRDPKIYLTPEGGLCVLAALRVKRKEFGYSHRCLTWHSDRGRRWTEAQDAGEQDFWLWRVAFHQKQGLGIAYKVGGDYHSRVYRTDNGRDFEPWVERMRGARRKEEYSNESGLCFDEDGTAWCLLRRDPQSALLGCSLPPYRRWQWRNTKQRIGGPVMAHLNDGRLLAVVRYYTVKKREIVAARTSFAWVDKNTGQLTECGQLPSAGDTSYAGLVVENGVASVSYYSTHEGKPAIYFAQMPISELAPSESTT